MLTKELFLNGPPMRMTISFASNYPKANIIHKIFTGKPKIQRDMGSLETITQLSLIDVFAMHKFFLFHIRTLSIVCSVPHKVHASLNRIYSSS